MKKTNISFFLLTLAAVAQQPVQVAPNNSGVPQIISHSGLVTGNGGSTLSSTVTPPTGASIAVWCAGGAISDSASNTYITPSLVGPGTSSITFGLTSNVVSQSTTVSCTSAYGLEVLVITGALQLWYGGTVSTVYSQPSEGFTSGTGTGTAASVNLGTAFAFPPVNSLVLGFGEQSTAAQTISPGLPGWAGGDSGLGTATCSSSVPCWMNATWMSITSVRKFPYTFNWTVAASEPWWTAVVILKPVAVGVEGSIRVIDSSSANNGNYGLGVDNTNSAFINVKEINGNSIVTSASGVQEVGVVGHSGTSLDGSTSGVLDENVKLINNSTVSTAAAGVQKVGIVGNAGATVDQAPGSAIPTNAVMSGVSDGTNLRVPYVDPCGYNAWTKYVVNISVTTQMVAGSASKNVYVCKVFIAPVAAAANVNFIESSTSGNACATTPAAMMGGTTAATGATLAANGGFILHADGRTWLQTGTSGDAVCIAVSAATTGVVWYVQQ